jgi:hypothetical protein
LPRRTGSTAVLLCYPIFSADVFMLRCFIPVVCKPTVPLNTAVAALRMQFVAVSFPEGASIFLLRVPCVLMLFVAGPAVDRMIALADFDKSRQVLALSASPAPFGFVRVPASAPHGMQPNRILRSMCLHLFSLRRAAIWTRSARAATTTTMTKVRFFFSAFASPCSQLAWVEVVVCCLLLGGVRLHVVLCSQATRATKMIKVCVYFSFLLAGSHACLARTSLGDA